MEKPTNIYDFFNKMSEADFNNRFLELSKRDEFSAAASLTATAEDITLVKEQLVQAGVNEDWVNNDKLFGAIIRHITSHHVSLKRKIHRAIPWDHSILGPFFLEVL